MSRVKRGVISNKKRKNILKAAKGFRFGRSTKEIEARVGLKRLEHMHSLIERTLRMI